jgi:4-diphosphocytidyl-2C-methyl-D-erythritol kinase
MVLVFPGVHVSTADAYRNLNLGLTSSLQDLRISRFIGQVQAGTSSLTGIFNDFEASILSAYPPIMEAKSFLQERGATVTMLSGRILARFSDESAFAASITPETWRVFPANPSAGI